MCGVIMTSATTTPVRSAEHGWTAREAARTRWDWPRSLRDDSSGAVRLLTHEHRLRFAFEVDVGIAADVDGDPLDRAAGETVRRPVRVVAGNSLPLSRPTHRP